MRNKIVLAGAAALSLLALPAMAEDTAPRGHQTGDFMIGASVIGLLPMNGGHVSMIDGTPNVSDSVTGQLDFTYFVRNDISLNLIAATTRHDVEVRGSALGTVDLGRVWALPPTLTLQYHPMPQSRYSPYVGVGVTYTVFYGEGGGRTAPVTKVDVENAFGAALNAGLDIEFAPNWLLNFDVKKFYLRPDVAVETSVGRINATTNLDPWVVGMGVRYRF
ncbi:outer membrane protein [Humitalea rosea]|uniref:Outer membrane protein n=1 Tax=Humitalea rosea TaxID=990373 RepID=A0A2W7I272_9PROT|nr:OmpW family outer membrane protein [Humitalea rosea]PZW41031.1 outer membrane protein [Humitalea rosea]